MPAASSSLLVRARPILGALIGVASALVGLGGAELVAGTSLRMRSPVLDVGDAVVDRVPAWLKDLAVSWFGTNDKIALLVGIGAALALYSAVVGLVSLRKGLRWGLVGVGLFGVIGVLASVASRGGVNVLTPVPTIVAAVLAGATLTMLVRSAPADLLPARETAPAAPAAAAATHDPRASQRRRFLAGLASAVVAGPTLAAIGRRLEARFSATDSRRAITLPAADRVAPAIPAGADVAEAAPFFTPNDSFYRIDTALAVPQVPAESWSLNVTGLVDRPLRFTYDELLRRELVESDITLTCVSNTIGGELIGTARWLGIRLDDLLDEAGLDDRADQIVGRSVDGYTCGFPVDALDGRDALVAIGMNGEPLPLEHGFPARLIVPGIYGYASATKWLTEIELTTFADFDHYWVPRGYAVEAPIKMQSRIDTPRGLDRIPPGPFVIGGVAWAQPVGIAGVEISIDDGPWTAVELGDDVGASTWRQWRRPWNATPGRHSITVRAIDRNGAIQTAERSEPLPDGATGQHTVVVLVDEA